jgi:hypothetical protein
MNKLLKEFLSYILVEETPSEKAKKMGLTSAGFGRWKNNQGVVTHKTMGSDLVPVSKNDTEPKKTPKKRTPTTQEPTTPKTQPPAVSATSGFLSKVKGATQSVVGVISKFRDNVYRLGAVGTGTADSTKGEQSSCSSAEDFINGRIVNGEVIPDGVTDEDITQEIPKLKPKPKDEIEARRRAIESAWIAREQKRYTDNGSEPPNKKWLKTAYRSGMSTRVALEQRADTIATQAAVRDGTLPPPMVTDEGKGRGKEAATSYLVGLRDAATEGSDDRKHYDKLLLALETAEDTDTCMFYISKDGRPSVLFVSNKQGVNDPHGNTGPNARIARIASLASTSGLSETGQQALGTAIGEARTAIGESVADSTRQVQEHFGRLSPEERSNADGRLQTLLTNPLPADRGRTKDYSEDILSSRPVKKAMTGLYCTDNPAQCKNGKPTTPIPEDYARSNLGRAFSTAVEADPSNGTLRKILIKLGSVANEPEDKKLLGPVLEVGSKMKAAAADAHGTIVGKVQAIDKQECGDSWDESSKACIGDDGQPRNGAATQTYVDAFMRDTHWDQYMCTDAGDDNCSAQSAVEETKLVDIDGHKVPPTKFRECLGTLTGYQGDTNNPDGQRELWRHLKSSLKVDPDEDSISVHGQGSGGARIGKEVYRTKGQASSLLTYLGPDMAKCVTGKD